MFENDLVPKHEVLSVEEAARILEKYTAKPGELPKILASDPAIIELNPNVGDLIKITRNNHVLGESYYYRVVIEG